MDRKRYGKVLMRLIQYINEDVKVISNDVDTTVNILNERCSYYIKLLKSNGIKTPFLRGFYTNIRDNYILARKSVRQDRRSQGMFVTEYKNLNNFLEESGHVRRDKSVIFSSDYHRAVEFGIPHFMFPEGKFNYTWIYSGDINIPRLFHTPSDANSLKTFLEGYNLFKKHDFDVRELEKINTYDDIPYSKILKDVEKLFVTNKNIRECHIKKYEIWFDCKNFYFMLLKDNNTTEVIKRIFNV